jgi:hypothetical protein
MKIRILTFLCASVLLASSAPAALIAYWDQNTADLDPGAGTAFGYFPGDFPQAANQGSGSLALANFDATLVTTGTLTGAYDFISNFSGTTLTAQPAIPSGGALSPEGGTQLSPGVFANNGMSILMTVSTLGYEDIQVSWDQRGTSTGFTGRQFAYSTDGVNFTDFGTDTGVLTSTFVTKLYDLSAVTAVDNASSVVFRITLTGASNSSQTAPSTGNNRFDNLTITGTPAIPEPGTAILALLSLAAAGAVTMRSRLG